MKLRIGSRKSPLARAQARQVAAQLTAAQPELDIEWVWITTSGDRFRDRPLQNIGGKGLFLKEIQAALLAGEIDLAIHSGKDIPAGESDGLVLTATPRRASPWDLLLSHEPLAEGAAQTARIGTGSGRRGAQLRRRWPQADVVPIRGNVGTRLGKVSDGELAAVVLAEAGMDRLEVPWDGARERLTWMLPATAQGTLALEVRAGDDALRERLAAVHDPETWLGFTAERAVLTAIGGDCFTPFGAFAERRGDRMRIRAGLWAPDGAAGSELETEGPAGDAPELGRELGERLLAEAGHLL